MALAERTGRSLTVLWYVRTGRFGLEYSGPVASTFGDYFQALPGVRVVPVADVAPQPGAAGVDVSALTPLAKTAEPGKPVAMRVDPETARRLLEEPLLVDASGPERDVWVAGSVHPFGAPEDREHVWSRYPSAIGTHKMTPWLLGLRKAALRLRLHDADALAVSALLRRMRSKHGRLVAIHVRATDLVVQSTAQREQSLRAVLQHELGSPETGVFVAADCDEGVALVRTLAESLGAGDRVHSASDTSRFENSVQGTHGALVDLFTLAGCDSLYGTVRSSFSAFAWLLSDADSFVLHS
jgi:hypothetical protein